MIFVFIFTDLKQDLNHVLHSLVDICFVQDTSELVIDSEGDLGIHLLNMLPDLFHQPDSNFDTIVRRFVKEQQEDLRGEHLMCNLLVDEVSQKCRGAVAHTLVVSLESFSKLNDQPIHKQLTHLWQLCVDDRSHGSIYRREWQTGGLCFHDASAEEPSTPDQILVE